MDRILQDLRLLFLRTLNEHGSDAAALSHIVIERAMHGCEPGLALIFSDGHRARVPVRAADCQSFCERRSISDLERLRSALLAEGQRLYAQLREEHINARGEHGERHGLLLVRQEGRRVGLWERIARWWLGHGQDYAQRRAALRPLDLRTPRAEQFGDRVVRLHGTLQNFIPAAEARGLELLRSNLSPAQSAQFAKHQCFDVIGGKTGNRYRIRHGRQMNVEQLDRRGRRICGWCFFPRGGLVAGDIMLGQKLALELFELEALAVAQRYRVAQERDWPW